MRLIRSDNEEWEAQWDDQYSQIESRIGSERLYIKDSVSKVKKQRLMLTSFTILLILIMPVLNYFYPEAFVYVLSAAMAFTIGTNLTIFIISTQIEDKADSMERKMESLIDELDKAATGLDHFQVQLNGIDIPAMTGIVEKAKEELVPSLQRLEAVSWESLSETIDKSFEFWDKIDKEKLEKVLSPFVQENGGMKPPLFAFNIKPMEDDYEQIWRDEGDLEIKEVVDEFLPELPTPGMLSDDYMPPL